MPTPDHLWDEHEVARYLGVTYHAVRKWRSLGKIGFVRVGALIRYVPTEIKAFAERNREHPLCRECETHVPAQRVLLPDEVDPLEPIYFQAI